MGGRTDCRWAGGNFLGVSKNGLKLDCGDRGITQYIYSKVDFHISNDLSNNRMMYQTQRSYLHRKTGNKRGGKSGMNGVYVPLYFFF